MKRTLFIALFILGCLSSFGQKIHFSDTSNRWHGFLLALELAPPIIVVCIYEFTSVYPDIHVYFKGSNSARIEFYRKIIIRHYDQLAEDFVLFGIIKTNSIEKAYVFESNVKYDAFLAIRK